MKRSTHLLSKLAKFTKKSKVWKSQDPSIEINPCLKKKGIYVNGAAQRARWIYILCSRLSLETFNKPHAARKRLKQDATWSTLDQSTRRNDGKLRLKRHVFVPREVCYYRCYVTALRLLWGTYNSQHGMDQKFNSIHTVY